VLVYCNCLTIIQERLCQEFRRASSTWPRLISYSFISWSSLSKVSGWRYDAECTYFVSLCGTGSPVFKGSEFGLAYPYISGIMWIEIHAVKVVLRTYNLSSSCADAPMWAWEQCRISPYRFLAECRNKRWPILSYGSFVLLYFALFAFDLYLVCVFFCTVLFVSISQVIGCEDRLRNDWHSVIWGVKLSICMCTVQVDWLGTVGY